MASDTFWFGHGSKFAPVCMHAGHKRKKRGHRVGPVGEQMQRVAKPMMKRETDLVPASGCNICGVKPKVGERITGLGGWSYHTCGGEVLGVVCSLKCFEGALPEDLPEPEPPIVLLILKGFEVNEVS